MCDPFRCTSFAGRAGTDHASAAVAGLGTQVDDPVGFGHHVEVVLDHDDAVAGIDQPVQHVDQLLDVGHVQADGRLVEHVQRVRGAARRARCARPDRVAAHLRELGDELDALRLAARQRRARLAEREIAEPHVLQQRAARWWIDG